MSKKSMQLWGGRFSKETDTLMGKFNSMLRDGKRMYREDLEGTTAYVLALYKTGI